MARKLNYAITAFVLALPATGLAHLLSVITPRPAFFGWIVGFVTAATMVLPFALEGSLKGEVCAMVINLVIWSMHRQPALQRAVPDGRRRRAILAAALGGDQVVVSHHNRAGQSIM